MQTHRQGTISKVSAEAGAELSTMLWNVLGAERIWCCGREQESFLRGPQIFQMLLQMEFC